MIKKKILYEEIEKKYKMYLDIIQKKDQQFNSTRKSNEEKRPISEEEKKESEERLKEFKRYERYVTIGNFDKKRLDLFFIFGFLKIY
jgi:hypothetical protein